MKMLLVSVVLCLVGAPMIALGADPFLRPLGAMFPAAGLILLSAQIGGT